MSNKVKYIKPKKFFEVFQQISDELSSQYSLGYISANPIRNGQWRRIVVDVERDATSTRTKQGYYAPTS